MPKVIDFKGRKDAPPQALECECGSQEVIMYENRWIQCAECHEWWTERWHLPNEEKGESENASSVPEPGGD